MNKKLTISIGALSTLLVVTPVISCSATSKRDNNYSESNPSRAKQESWSDKVTNIPPPITYQWNADQTTTIKSTLDFMNEKMGLYFPKPIGMLTPYEFANFIFEFFEQNGGGNTQLIMEWNGKTENIFLQLQRPLLDIIESFDGPPAITSSTTRYNGTVSNGLINIAIKLASSSSPMEALTKFWNLFGDYGKEIFGTDSVFQLFETMNTNVMLKNIVDLLEPFPKSALETFPTFFSLFKTMAQQMSSNTIGQEWAKSNNISEEFLNIDKYIINFILNSV